MKLRLLLLLLLSTLALAQTTRLADTHTFTTSGEIWPTSNSNGSINASFEEIFNGSPATVSVVIAGCKVGNTCDTLETYTTVANSVRNPTISKVYDYFKVTASWTGGTNATVVVNTTITTAVNGLGGGGGGSGTVTNVATTGPIGGGPITTTGTISCATCAIGPGSSTANHVAEFSGTDGVTLKDGGAAGSGTVTSIATTGPITGGTITTTGTLGCATCALTTLGNLASVAINTSLLPASAVGAQKLGSASFPFGDVNLFQTANGDDLIYGIANTATSPTGNFLHFQQPGSPNLDEFLVDVNGNVTGNAGTFAGALTVTGKGSFGNGSTNGLMTLGCNGSAPSLTAGAINFVAPNTCTGTQSYTWQGTAATGFQFWTNSSGAMTGSIVGSTGSGNVVLATSPTLITPALGTPASGVMTNVTGLPPGAVTSAQGNGTKFQLSTGTTTTNDCVKFDANGNTVDNGAACGSGGGTGALAALTNTTSVTVSNPSAATDTQLMELSLAAAYLNTAGQPYRIHGSGVLSTTTASTPQVTITAKLCSVSGCGSGTVTPLAAIQSTALNTVAISNATWIYDLTAATVGTGASCNLIVKGSPGLVIENAGSVATADSVYADANTAVSSPNQNCANALFLDFFVQQSATGASNSYKQLLGSIMPQGGGPVLSVGLKTGAVSLADASATQYVAGGGSAQAQTATLSPVLAANSTGSVVWWLPTAANTAAAPTLAVNGLTAKTITKCGTVALVAGDLLTTQPAQVIYDGTEWVLLNPQGIGCATTSGGYIFNGVTAATAVVMPAANSTKLWAFIANASLVTSAHFTVNVTTVDNSANLYNFAVFCAAGDPRCTSGNPVCQTGAIAGSSIPTPGSTGLKIIAWSGACGPFVNGQRYYFAETAVTSTLVIGGVANLPSPVCGQAPATNNTTASAVWTTPITYSGDTNIVGCNGPALAIYPN